MDYEKKYKEALERAKEKYTKCYSPALLDYIFPELKSEDVEIRRSIIRNLKRYIKCIKDGYDASSAKDFVVKEIEKQIAWLEKQGKQKPTLPKWKYKNDNTPLLRDSLILNKYGCVAKSPSGAFVNDVWVIDYDELAKLPKEELEKQGEQETLCDKCRKEHPSHSCQDITELGRCSVEHEQDTDNSYCQENCKGFQETGKCFADGDCKAKREAESNDKNEPKFHEGDWVIYNNDICQIVKREEGCNILVTQFGVEKEPVNERNLSTAKLWDISDANEGDVLFHSDSASNGIFIFKEIIDKGFAKGVICYCDYDSEDHFCLGEHHTCCWTDAKILYPATKEQRDTLFAKMKEAGYAFDFEKKELKKLGQPEVTKTSDQEEIAEIPFGAKDSELQEATYFIPKGFHAEIDDDKVVIKKGEKPAAWSEEDEKRIANILSVLSVQVCWDGATGEKMNPYQKEIDWLKSLKDRVQPKQEWSEDDKKMLESIIYDFGKGRQSTTSQDNWLKSLAPWSIPKIRFV